MGFLSGGATAQNQALDGFDDPVLTPLREQAQAARAANRRTFVARLPMFGDPGMGDVPVWSAALQQIGQHDWTLSQWTVCPEAGGPVAYAVFTR